jgi:hypothetical protein
MTESTSNFARDQRRCRTKYSLELARQASRISSVMLPASINAEVVTTANGFKQQHGADDLRHFLLLLVESLETRGRSSAVDAVHAFMLHEA